MVTVNAELGSSVAVTFTDSNSHSVIKMLTGSGSALAVTLDSSDIGSGSTQLLDGSITVSANATDAAGNTSMAGNSSFTLDTAKPVAPVFALVAAWRLALLPLKRKQAQSRSMPNSAAAWQSPLATAPAIPSSRC